MAERRCIIERGEGFFDVEMLVPSPKLSKHLEDVGADTWFPNPNKNALSPVSAKNMLPKKRQIYQDLYPVWGNLHYHACLIIFSFPISRPIRYVL